jgi:LAGLIDADG DNA endonuclease family
LIEDKNSNFNFSLLAFSSSSNSNNNNIVENYHSEKEKGKKQRNYPINRKRANSNSNLILTDYLKEALIGLTLGDISLEKTTKNSNVRLRFDQGLIHSDYLYFLYDLFKIYTLSSPKSTNRKPDKRTGKIYNSLIFKTRMLPCFNYLWDLFYKDNKKVVPSNINSLLTEVGLAF